ncbi:hypothetical protein [Pelagibius marinus]|uniref:hypothetical protein n=1 Tax=Pelagibius marinus TaxID=2762760 RepID=UPI0018731982|nr:hypothetical protein [Pelagibius marinus]
MGKWFFFFVLLASTGLAGAPAAGANELLSTHPSHYRSPGEAMSGGSSSILDRTKQARAGSHIIVRDEGALQETWVLNRDLSRACNRRLFRQKRDQFLVGIVDGRTYGAAVGGHGSLVDRVKMAENQVVYLFRGQGTTDCRVYHRTK